MPTYQAERYLPRLLASLDGAPTWEVVIVDDGSTDDTIRIASEWLSSRQSGALIKKAHRGPGVARQFGLKEAHGDYVAFADADDEVLTCVHDSMATVLDEFGGDVGITAFETAPGSPSPTSNDESRVRRVAPQRVLTSRAAIWGKVYRREFLRQHSIDFPPLRSADDVVFSWRTARDNPVTYETAEVGYRYWIDPHGQLTQDPRYFLEGTDSLMGLWRESFRPPARGRLLAAYACGTGLGHILRKSSPREWPRVVARGVKGTWPWGATP